MRRTAAEGKVTHSDLRMQNSSMMTEDYKPAFPLSAAKTIQNYSEFLSEVEQAEILSFKVIYYIN